MIAQGKTSIGVKWIIRDKDGNIKEEGEEITDGNACKCWT